MILAEDTKKHIDHWIAKYPADQKRSAVVASLLEVQKQNGGWLSEAAMDAVAAYLELPKIEVYEVGTFYDMFELEPVGQHKIAICTNISCMLCGSDKILDAVKKRLGIGPGEMTADGKFFLREVECLGACVEAPMGQIDDKKYHLKLTPESIVALIDKLEKEPQHGA
jgi:NADH-quinone oxidoreductase subunit E